MKHSALARLYNQVLAQRNLSIAALLGSIGVNVLLTLATFSLIGKERVVVVPSVVERDFWVATDNVSDSYLEQMSQFFAMLVLNVTPSNFKVRSEQLLRHVATQSYAMVKEKLMHEQKEVERRAITTLFHPVAFKVDRSKLIVEVKGELKTWIGSSEFEARLKHYQIQYVLKNGRLTIQNFSEINDVKKVD